MKMEQPTVEVIRATQFAEFLRPVTNAAAIVFDERGARECLAAVEKKTQQLAELFRLVMTALKTGQDLELVMPKLLELIGTVEVPGDEKFIVKSFFTKDNPEVKFAWISENFTRQFGETVEEGVPATTLRAYLLKENSLDPPIMQALGKNFQVSLANLASLLEKQPNGEEGDLLTDGNANIIYPSDLWAVGVRWSGGGWCVRAGPAGFPHGWYAGGRVFGR